MTCPRCGARPPRIKYCREGFLCLQCGCPWSEQEEDEQAWGILHAPLFCAVHPPGPVDRPTPSLVPKGEWVERKDLYDTGNRGLTARYTAAAITYRHYIKKQTIDFCEQELRKVGKW